MPEQPLDRTDLKSHYAAQLAADLETNSREQERAGSEIAALRTRLSDLERESGLLLGMQEALTAEPVTAAAVPGPGQPPAGRSFQASARLPVARRAPDAADEAGPARKTGKAGRAGRKTARPRPSRPAGKRTSGGATLRDLIAGLLAAHDGPQSAAEITDAVARSHPEREVGATVVRNTLEALVAKGRVHRSKEQKSVFYSAVESSPAAKEPLAAR